MDLIGAIFDDKRIQKNRVQGKANNKSVSSSAKTRRTTKSSASDKKPKPTNRSISQNDRVKHGSSKGDVRKSCSEIKIEKEKTDRRNFKEEVSSLKSSPEGEEGSDKKEITSIDKESTGIDKSIIRNVSKYFQTSDSIEDSFESALEVYNDCTFDERDAEFGRESFKSLDKDYFVEAYNKEGYELLQTSIQLSFDSVDIILEDDVENAAEKDHQTVFTSDDDTDKTFVETYNSMGYELRKIELQNRAEEYVTQQQNNRTSSHVKKSSSSASSKSILNRFDSTSSAGSYILPAECSNDQTESVIKTELQQQNSIEEPHFEEKSIQDLIVQLHSPVFNLSTVKRTPSSTSKKSKLSRFDSTGSTGSYTSATGVLHRYRSKYDDSVDVDDDIPNPAIFFEVKTKADMIIQELLETEHNYIENLTKIKRDYIRYFKRINIDSKGMFGNILDILKETKDFYQSLQVCGNDYEYIANTFKDYRHLFELYPEYSKNKSNADLVVHARFKPILQERQKLLGDKLDLASYLLNPVQRLGRYILLLKNLQKSVRKPECLDEAIKLVEQSMKKGNDFVAIDSILDCDIDLTTKGSYIDREKFVLLKPKREEIVLFLFEQIVVFTHQQPNTEKFLYKSSICFDDLQIINSEGDNQVFHLRNYTKSKNNNQEQHTYIVEARSVKLRETWVQLIQNKLWEQLQQVKALSKAYKIPDVPEKKQTKSIAPSSVKSKSTSNVQKRGRTASDRNSVKRNSKFYLEETSGYGTL